VLVTRPAHQAGNLCRLLQDAGAAVERYPGLEIEFLPVTAERRALLERLPQQALLVFTSLNAVTGLRDLLAHQALPLPRHIPCAAVGRRTGSALEQLGMQHISVAPAPYTSEALMTCGVMQPPAQSGNAAGHTAAPADADHGRRCMVISGAGGRGVLAETLRQQGGRVSVLEVYRRIPPTADPSPLRAWLHQNLQSASEGVIVVTSGEILDNLLMLAGQSAHQALLTANLVTVSGRVRDLARQRGFTGTITLSEPNDAAMVRSVVGWWHQTERQANP